MFSFFKLPPAIDLLKMGWKKSALQDLHAKVTTGISMLNGAAVNPNGVCHSPAGNSYSVLFPHKNAK